jgi:hypothetical protein
MNSEMVGLAADVDPLLERVSERTRIVFIASRKTRPAAEITAPHRATGLNRACDRRRLCQLRQPQRLRARGDPRRLGRKCRDAEDQQLRGTQRESRPRRPRRVIDPCEDRVPRALTSLSSRSRVAWTELRLGKVINPSAAVAGAPRRRR